MKLEKAKAIAQFYVNMLRIHCDRIEVAGSIRRERPEVKDIEIVCISKVSNPDRLGDLHDFLAVLHDKEAWKFLKYGPKYKQILLPEGINLDLFIANENNWGSIFAIRTGPGEFSHKTLACGWVRAGYKSEGGVLWKDGKPTYIREEEDLFDLIGLNYIEPKDRK